MGRASRGEKWLKGDKALRVFLVKGRSTGKDTAHTGKHSHYDWRSACLEAKHLTATEEEAYVAYKCGWCIAWHVGHALPAQAREMQQARHALESERLREELEAEAVPVGPASETPEEEAVEAVEAAEAVTPRTTMTPTTPVGDGKNKRGPLYSAYITLYHRVMAKRRKDPAWATVPLPKIRQGKLVVAPRHLELLREDEAAALFPAPARRAA